MKCIRSGLAVWLVFAVFVPGVIEPAATADASDPVAAPPRESLPAGDVLKGVFWEYRTSSDSAWQAVPPALEERRAFQVRGRFSWTEPSDQVSARLIVQWPLNVSGVAVNDRGVELPGKGMSYRELYLPGGFLRHGENLLQLDLSGGAKTDSPGVGQRLALTRLLPTDLAFSTGPVLGAAGTDFFTVTCELNLPAEVFVVDEPSGERLVRSPSGTAHRIQVPCDLTHERRFVLQASNGQVFREVPLRLPAAATADRLTLVCLGDTQGGGRQYAELVKAAMTHDPQLIVRTGDFVHWGPNRWEWDSNFFEVAKESLTRVPHYAVPGNHDVRMGVTWMAERVFHAPDGDGGEWNWSQRVGPALLIGVNGADSWSADSQNIQWLERVLEKGSGAPFIFFFSHYPPVSSGHHAIVKNGKFRERMSQEAMEVILPLLSRHQATAYISGHEHFYERLEPESGVTVLIVSGGVSTRRKAWDPPSSKVWSDEHHYSLLEIGQGACTLRTLTSDGLELDRRIWTARGP